MQMLHLPHETAGPHTCSLRGGLFCWAFFPPFGLIKVLAILQKPEITTFTPPPPLKINAFVTWRKKQHWGKHLAVWYRARQQQTWWEDSNLGPSPRACQRALHAPHVSE